MLPSTSFILVPFAYFISNFVFAQVFWETLIYYISIKAFGFTC